MVCFVQFMGLSAHAQSSSSDAFSFDSSNLQDPGQMASGLNAVSHWVFYVFYLLGGIFLGIGCYKLKRGDMGGFGMHVAGGVALFFVPALISLFKYLGQQAGGGN